jgi:ubiquinone/menaquinone biosynthesis C-methylase UbiE
MLGANKVRGKSMLGAISKMLKKSGQSTVNEQKRSPVLNFTEINQFLEKLETAKDDDQLRKYFSEYSAQYDKNLPDDPFSDQYRRKQFSLYEQLSGKQYSPDNEISTFDVEEHALRPFPYCHGSSETVGNQLMAIGYVIKAMKLPKGSKILEFGPGWGNTTLALAKMGYAVTAVDIENNFVELIKKRASMEFLDINVIRGDFSYIETVENEFDAILFFECFHHAQDHNRIMENFDRALRPGGIVCFGAEPITGDFPIPWGLRMDGESLWAIRRNGWLELGFNKKYFNSALERAGWIGLEQEGQDGPWSKVIIAKRKSEIGKSYTFKGGELRSQCGILDDSTIVVKEDDEGYVLFGPYDHLPAGQWEVELIFNEARRKSGSITIDIVDQNGSVTVEREKSFKIDRYANDRICIEFRSKNALRTFEMRVKCKKGSTFSLRGFVIRPINR